MDINTIRGLLTLILLILFLGIVAWAYSSKRKKDFDEAARLPLQDEDDPTNNRESRKDKRGSIDHA